MSWDDRDDGIGGDDRPSSSSSSSLPYLTTATAPAPATNDGSLSSKSSPSFETAGRTNCGGAPSASSFDVGSSSPPSSSSSAADAFAMPPARSLAFAAATGSGKTLAYLLPIIHSAP